MQEKFGIVGFGVVGKSALRFLAKNSKFKIFVWDKRELSPQEKILIKNDGAELVDSSKMAVEAFLDQFSSVLLSPGIDASPFQQHKHKFISELDLFARNFSKKTIAITGTLGKTTVTKLLHELIPTKTLYGGNVGVGMLDLLEKQEEIDQAVLELSSFQLEQNKSFAPDIALWTNFYPNHLDRHKNIKNYFEAKSKIFSNQRDGQVAIFNAKLLVCDKRVCDQVNLFSKSLQEHRGHQVFVFQNRPTKQELAHRALEGSLVWFVEDGLVRKARILEANLTGVGTVLSVKDLPQQSFLQNWLFIIATLDCLGLRSEQIKTILNNKNIILDEHRLELFASVNGVDFYNDSKATVIEATMAAVTKIAEQDRPIILVLGGQSKGVDRRPLVSFLKKQKNIKKVFCLGASCPAFAAYEHVSSLSELSRDIMQKVAPGDLVLFSPSGASFDMFKNYKERGRAFKASLEDESLKKRFYAKRNIKT
ncbi:UDP-N-acetylmuramoyl-L-alanine--D-glutamate ligase [Candidatus Babeliales bacterium]|nr:UDP-N-acetylmuramoyl-L-alanine--D-glutamate ligase [Candidatus Babeliales bacterium]